MKNDLNSSTEFSHTKQINGILFKSKQMFKVNQWETCTTGPPQKKKKTDSKLGLLHN